MIYCKNNYIKFLLWSSKYSFLHMIHWASTTTMKFVCIIILIIFSMFCPMFRLSRIIFKIFFLMVLFFISCAMQVISILYFSNLQTAYLVNQFTAIGFWYNWINKWNTIQNFMVVLMPLRRTRNPVFLNTASFVIQYIT